MNELPVHRSADRPMPGPHVVLHEDGTRQEVFAGPNMVPRLRPVSWLWRYLWDTVVAVSLVVAVITAGLLVLEFAQLTVSSRLACGALIVVGCGGYALRYVPRRKVRS